MKIFLLTLCFVLGILSACSSKQKMGAIRISDFRQQDPIGLKVIEMQIQKSKLLSALGNEGINSRVRIIETVTSVMGLKSPVPEYRLFDIALNSAYDVLGLKNGDVLVAADGYVPQYSGQFREFVKLLADAQTASIEIRRMDNMLRFQYNFY